MIYDGLHEDWGHWGMVLRTAPRPGWCRAHAARWTVWAALLGARGDHLDEVPP